MHFYCWPISELASVGVASDDVDLFDSTPCINYATVAT